jgi:putative DNA primase/helicase
LRAPDLNACRAMLSHIPANDRDNWVRMGMALHSEFPGDDGFDAFDTWSKSAESYDAKRARSVWKGFKPGKVKIGTLIDEAKKRGFVFDRNAEHAPALTPEQITQQREEREARERKARAETEALHNTARAEAERRFAAASDTGTSEYIPQALRRVWREMRARRNVARAYARLG